MRKILIVEDDPTLSDVLSTYLTSAEYECHIIDNGLNVEPWFNEHKPDMVLLDVMLPGKTGIELCEAIRVNSNIPIIMITGRAEESDRLRGLETGADDYICKPFRPREVVARVNTVFRRVQPEFGRDSEAGGAYADSKRPEFHLDGKRHKLYVRDDEISLTAVQCNLLSLLMENEGVIMSREKVMTSIYPDKRIVSNRTIDSHVRELRKHIAAVLPEEEVIFSIYGAGYKFEMPIFSEELRGSMH